LPLKRHHRSRLHEFEHEFVLRLGRVRRILVSGVVRVAQGIAFLDQPEACRFDFLPEKRFVKLSMLEIFSRRQPQPDRT